MPVNAIVLAEHFSTLILISKDADMKNPDTEAKAQLQKAREVYRRLANPDKCKGVSDRERWDTVKQLLDFGNVDTLVHLLPMIFNHKGKPYQLGDHFPFEPVFTRVLPQNLMIKSGRQCSKSTSLASRGLLISAANPHFSSLYVTPLYEQIRRFSTQYIGKFIDESPLKRSWIGTNTENSVLQRTFKNQSRMFFSFAGLSADRIRGISTDMVSFDEVQDFDPNLLPVIKETMSHSKWRLTMHTGTPKTLDNALEYEWQRSSQAEWAIPCSCGKINYPCLELDLIKMIGPVHDDIGEVADGKKPGVICAKCGQAVNPRIGRWHHRKPELRWDYPGYHIPQLLMPIHYGNKKRWAELVAKMNGAGNYTIARFYNEVMGEACDVGAKLITETDLRKAACLPFPNKPHDPQDQAGRRDYYIHRFLGVDWGGGGEADVSFTTAAVVGMRADGRMEVIYGQRLLDPNNPLAEAQELMRIYNTFHCDMLCHDYNGSGNLRELFILHAGLPPTRIVPMVYSRTASQDIMVPHLVTERHHRRYWLLDKARALELVCEMIKLLQIKFFQYDFVDVDNRGLLRDFLSLMSNKSETARAGEVYNIIRTGAFPDDFAHSVTFAACGLWQHTQRWPNVAKIANLVLTAQQHNLFNEPNPWTSPDDLDSMF